jgi:hypothetical protein
MRNERYSHFLATATGWCAAGVFWLAYVVYLYSLPSDPQLPIAYLLSPIVAAWFGVAVGLLTVAAQIAPAAIQNRQFLRLILYAGFGIGGVVTLFCGIMSEHYQMTHPTQHLGVSTGSAAPTKD